jgi:hypothetical protein
MTRSAKSVRNCRWFVALAGLCAVLVMAMPATVSAQGAGGPGVDITIRASNRSTSDTPFCGVGGGMVGDRLTVDAFMDQDGIVTGTAIFTAADGAVTEIALDRLFPFFGGVLVQNNASQDMRVRPEASRRRWSTSSCRGVAEIPCPRSRRESTQSLCESGSPVGSRNRNRNRIRIRGTGNNRNHGCRGAHFLPRRWAGCGRPAE